MSRILILTAGFGEGHNTAARSVADALLLEAPGTEVRVLDPLQEALPRLTGASRRVYLGLINHMPRGWEAIYHFVNRSDRAQHGKGWLAPAAKYLRKTVEEFRPDAVVTTYPLYLNFWEELFPRPDPPPCPLHVVVTDSLTINAMWTRGRCDTWCVTDPGTLEKLVDLGAPRRDIVVTGFPVSPRFDPGTRKIAAPSATNSLRLLYFPIASRRHTQRIIRTLATLPTPPPWDLTIVLGKQKDRFSPMVDLAIARGDLPGDTKIVGWTKHVPELLASHHLVLGKAGGASVHEARTAARPMIVHYVVPGQEVGNTLLLKQEGSGFLLDRTHSLQDCWEDLRENDWALWKTSHAALMDKAPTHPARHVARHVLSHHS